MPTTETATPSEIPTQARNATLVDLAQMLKVQHDLKHDVVVPASAITCRDGNLRIAGAGPDGPGTTGTFRPTEICDEGLSEKLRIPREYLRRLRSDRVDLFDANINGWLRGTPHYPLDAPIVPPDDRRFLIRCFNHPDLNEEGIARAFLSQSFKLIDNLDVLTAALDGARNASAEVEVVSCDLSERRMTVKLTAPEISVLAPRLLERYRSPFTGAAGKDLPVVFAGIVLSNSETGGGAFTIVPRIVIQICKNGATVQKDALRAVHLGAKMEEGVVKWSEETLTKNVELVRSQTADAMQTFLNVEYLQTVIDRMEAKSEVPLTAPADAVQIIASRLRYTDAQRDLILDHFIRGGDPTAGGIMQAVTSAAQVVADPEASWLLEASALDALELAASLG